MVLATIPADFSPPSIQSKPNPTQIGPNLILYYTMYGEEMDDLKFRNEEYGTEQLIS